MKRALIVLAACLLAETAQAQEASPVFANPSTRAIYVRVELVEARPFAGGRNPLLSIDEEPGYLVYPLGNPQRHRYRFMSKENFEWQFVRLSDSRDGELNQDAVDRFVRAVQERLDAEAANRKHIAGQPVATDD